jgi:hypothetical protein
MPQPSQPAPDPRADGLRDIGRVAETQYMIRPILASALKGHTLTGIGRKMSGHPSAQSQHDLWTASYADRFFDMGTFLRLGTAIQTGLRSHYFATCPPAAQAPHHAVFQRLGEPKPLVRLYRDGSGYDPRTNPEWTRMQELMLHRHLYAHRSGLVDDKYVDELKQVAGVDISADIKARNYPVEDVYWFRPLRELPDFIESARRFFHALPGPPGAQA